MKTIGRYIMRVLNSQNEVQREVSCINIVTNRGRANVYNANFGSLVQIGTGRAPENLSTTALGNLLVDYPITGTWSNKFTSSINTEKNIIRSSAILVGRTNSFTSNQIISEVGISNVSGDLNTYSLLRDVSGELTTITINSGELLEIEYEVTLECVYVQLFAENHALGKVITYRLPALNSFTNSTSVNSTVILKSAIDGSSSGTIPAEVHKGNAGVTAKVGNTFTATIPANVTSYSGDAFGFLVDNLNGFTIGLFFKTPLKLESAKEYIAKAVYDY